METLLQDLRFGLRSLTRRPWLALLTILTLGLGIGANTAIFSMVNGVLLQPLPYEDGAQLVRVQQAMGNPDVPPSNLSVPELQDLRDENQTFSGLSEYHTMFFNLLSHGEPERVQTGVVSWDFFQLLGVKPLHGRLFTAEEDHLAAEPVLILGYDYWQTKFGGDPGIVGEVVEMNNRMHTIVGVLSPVPTYPNQNQVWMPWFACPFRSGEAWRTGRQVRALTVIGRTGDGVDVERAQTDLSRLAGQMREMHPEAYPDQVVPAAVVTPLKEELTRGARSPFLILLGISAFVLLIACANVANLTLSRLSQRSQEIGLRSALGAGRGRIARQLLTESTMVALAGGLFGVVLAYAMTGRLSSFASGFTPRASEVGIDLAVLLFTLVAAVGAGIAVGIVPIFFANRTLTRSAREGGTQGGGHSTARSALVMSQVALAFVLLFGTGLMVKSLSKLQGVDPGFVTQKILSMRVDLDWAVYTTPAQRRFFFDELLARIRTRTEVEAVGVGSIVPLSGQGVMLSNLEVEGVPTEESDQLRGIRFHGVTAGYLEVLDVPVLAGRTIQDSDREGSLPVAVISNTVARRYPQDVDPIGSRVRLNGGEWLQVVGIVGDVKDQSLEAEDSGQVYTPVFQDGRAGQMAATLLVRTSGEPGSIARGVTEDVYSVDPRQPVSFVQSMEEVYRSSFASPRITTVLLTLFSLLAMVISTTGIAGVIGFSVGQRTREIGIRIALGAERGHVLFSVLRHGLLMVGVGLLIGGGSALLLSGVMEGMLFQVEVRDLETFAAVSGLLALAALFAAYWPARRATRIDPVIAFRAE